MTPLCRPVLCLVLAAAGCNAPSRREMVSAGARPAALMDAVEGDYVDADGDANNVQRARSLWQLLTHDTMSPAPAAVTRLTHADGRLVAELREDDITIGRQVLPLSFDGAYWAGNHSAYDGGTQCTFPAYVANDLAVGPREDGTLVVVSKTRYVAVFMPFPGFNSGPAVPLTAWFRRVTTTRPAGPA